MQFGLSAPFRGPLANPSDIRTIAGEAERLGYGILTVADHIVVPTLVDSTYPYSETGEFAWTADGTSDCMEQFTLLAWLAAVTSEIRLLSSVVVVPHRNPLFMAKSIATMDRLSNGRITVGCGAGWLREEFEALNIANFEQRGRVTDEYLRVMKALWQESPASYDGEFISFPAVGADPKPVQTPHPPIWIGGESMPAIRRTVALGDAWYPFGSNPKFRMDTIESYVARRDRLFTEAEKADRDPATIGLAYNCAFHNEIAQTDSQGQRQLFTGSAEQRAADIDALAAVGVTTMIMAVTAPGLEATIERMQAFSEDVMPLVS